VIQLPIVKSRPLAATSLDLLSRIVESSDNDLTASLATKLLGSRLDLGREEREAGGSFYGFD
jgi:hypothetical protein